MKSLGIIITSKRCSPHIAPMLRAAGRKGLSVHLHFACSGVCLLSSLDLDAFTQLAHITICRESAEAHQIKELRHPEASKMLVPSDNLVRLIDTCDRHVVL